MTMWSLDSSWMENHWIVPSLELEEQFIQSFMVSIANLTDTVLMHV